VFAFTKSGREGLPVMTTQVAAGGKPCLDPTQSGRPQNTFIIGDLGLAQGGG